jgi:hypothetical protein
MRSSWRDAIALLILATLLAPITADGQAHGGRFRDPEDGRLDLSDYLLNQKGFLPVPIIITEPAVGYGGGVALTFFSQSFAEGRNESGKLVPPTIYGGAGFYTSDGSYGGGLLLFHPFHQDQFRYLGALGGASLDLDFYGFSAHGPLADNPVAYTIEPLFLFQRFQARLEGTDLFVGAHYEYLRTTSTFGAALPEEIPEHDLKVNAGGIGGRLELDTRDNVLDARRGTDVSVEGTWFEPAWGSDDSFAKYEVKGLFYGRPRVRWGYGLRVETKLATGDAPFFEKPYLSMRGLPAMQYANDVTLLGEAELRYSLDPRWTLVAFGGAGRVGDTYGDLRDAPTIGAGGAGVRYLVARKLGFNYGFDLAYGRGGEFAFYIHAGAPWR